MPTIKRAIIGAAWLNDSKTLIPASFVLPEEMSLGADESYLLGALSFRTGRYLPKITLAKGTRLYFFSNNKREGYRDADYSVSANFPIDVANNIIETGKTGLSNWRAANSVA